MHENLSDSDRESKRLEVAVRKAKEFFEIFSTISHELRTPLTLSIGPLEELLRGEYGKIGRGVQDQIGLALRNNRRLLKLVNHLLVFARLEAGGEHVCTVRRDINQFLSGIVDAFTFLAEKKNISLTRVGKVCNAVSMDSAKMERALFNIIGNAFKFTPVGGSITIAVEKDTRRRDGDYINIAVKDTGIGIHEKDLPQIFERFKQVDSRCIKKHEGTGLGLSLAKELIELQGGTVKVESIYGKGSTFTICLPLGKGYLHERFHNREYRDDIIVSQSEIELSDLGYEGERYERSGPPVKGN